MCIQLLIGCVKVVFDSWLVDRIKIIKKYRNMSRFWLNLTEFLLIIISIHFITQNIINHFKETFKNHILLKKFKPKAPFSINFNHQIFHILYLSAFEIVGRSKRRKRQNTKRNPPWNGWKRKTEKTDPLMKKAVSDHANMRDFSDPHEKWIKARI